MLTIPVYVVIMLVLIHWEADFSMQTHEMATQKSKSNYWLGMHALVYTGVTLLFWRFFIFDVYKAYTVWNYVCFSVFIFATHFITDYITSRITSKLFAKGKYHEFFCTIGIDQIFHTIELIIAYLYFV